MLLFFLASRWRAGFLGWAYAHNKRKPEQMLYELDGVIPQLGEGAWVAPDASLIGDVQLLAGASVWFNAVIRGDSGRLTIGERTNIQDGSVLHTDEGIEFTIGAGVTVGHKVMLHGCRIADHVLIGMGSVIMNNATIGTDSILGAGSLVAEGKDIPEGVLALGVPARVKRALTDQEKQLIRWSAEHYAKNAARFRAGLAVATRDSA
jgi:carbonic anhydrase/acetyltransferase-like protein (isoleucine patch superfamily)